MSYILTLSFVVPLMGGIMISMTEKLIGKTSYNTNKLALTLSIVAMLLSFIIYAGWDNSVAGYQFTSNIITLDSGLSYRRIGLDSISLYRYLLTSILYPLLILASWKISKNSKLYFSLMLVLEGILLMFFSTVDIIAFYMLFEIALVPLFIIIGIWGSSAARVRASRLLFVYTIFGSLFMLISIIYIVHTTGTSDFEGISISGIPADIQYIVWLGIFLGLAVKTPLVPFHLWLTRAHVEAPVAGSMLLAGVILKLATYGFLRILIGLLPVATEYYSPFVQALCIVTLIYSSLSTIIQSDFKVLIAYSSVAHRAIGTIGLFSNTLVGIQGAILLAIAHGLISPSIFMLVGGVLYDRYHTRSIRYYRGLNQLRPIFGILMFINMLANRGTPITLNWLGEFMVLSGNARFNLITMFIASSGIVLSAIYSIWLYARICGGGYSMYLGYSKDINKREFIVVGILTGLTLILGIAPNIIINNLELDVINLIY